MRTGPIPVQTNWGPSKACGARNATNGSCQHASSGATRASSSHQKRGKAEEGDRTTHTCGREAGFDAEARPVEDVPSGNELLRWRHPPLWPLPMPPTLSFWQDARWRAPYVGACLPLHAVVLLQWRTRLLVMCREVLPMLLPGRGHVCACSQHTFRWGAGMHRPCGLG